MAEKVSSISKTSPSLFLHQLDFKLTSFQYSEAILMKPTFSEQEHIKRKILTALHYNNAIQ